MLGSEVGEMTTGLTYVVSTSGSPSRVVPRLAPRLTKPSCYMKPLKGGRDARDTSTDMDEMEDDRAPDLPSVAVKMVFGTTGVEEVEPKFLADFPRPSFKVAHSLVLKPVMSVKENMAVSKVCVVMPESKQAEVKANTGLQHEVNEAERSLARVDLNHSL